MSTTRDFQSWAVRLRRRDGFGWARPTLAAEGLFAWYNERRIEDEMPSSVALFGSRRDAQRSALKVRSRRLSAMPVPVDVAVKWVE